MGNLASRYVDAAPEVAAKREPLGDVSNKRVALPALSNKSNSGQSNRLGADAAAGKASAFDKRAYQREYMRKRRATSQEIV